MSVRTRFAPSPTGYLHVGGVRTALFNWLFARRHGGQFILRIDDTDAARHVEEAIRPILDGFRWLGMNWDEGPEIGGPHAPYFQSQRGAHYRQALETLIERGLAYPCLATPQELDTARQAAKAAKQPFVYRGPQRNLPPDECLAIFREKKAALRFKVPPGQTTVLHDKVRGQVEWQTDLLGDFTISRAGGDPLYNLASIVDDVAMKITHIIRAEEHLANTHPQLLIARGLQAGPIEFAHVPYVAAPGGKKKLSKRDPPPGVMVALEEYRQAGYLPEALLNALARLGWSLDDKTEIMALDVIIANFSLERVTASAAALDPDKLFWIQDHYMRALPVDERIKRLAPILQREKLISDPATPQELEMLRRIDAACGDRIKLTEDIVRYGGFFFRDQLEYEPKAVKNLQRDDAVEVLGKIHDAFAALTAFDVPALEAAVSQLAASTGLGGKINHVLRAAVTGLTVGAGIYDCIAILGKEKTLRRLEQTKEAIVAGTLK